jgi:RNA-directed DNA polymerase
MLTHILDVRLVQLARAHRVTYSRYADDLTFSTNQKAFPSALATHCDEPGSEWTLAKELVDVIERSGFLINPIKTRMQVKTSRQLVTGLTVNTKVNIPQDYWRSARACCNALFQTGAYHRRQPVASASDETPKYEMITSLHPLEGILSYVHHVKRDEYMRENEDNVATKTPGRKLYAKLLFYKYFVALQKPMIVCEGKTDNIYLKYAIRHFENFYPQLGQVTDKGFQPAVSLFSYANQAHQIIDITGGASNLHGFINRYRTNLARYKHRPLRHAVVMLLDNDNGLSPSFRGDLKKHFSVDVNLKSTNMFYHLTDNLYLVKTLEIGTEGTSCIEDCFDDALKATKLEGKTFKADKPSPATEYGKVQFAEKVVVPKAGEIVWDQFAPLLARIAAAISDYSPPTAVSVPAAA